jgi:excisionase family DNA binding protein
MRTDTHAVDEARTSHDDGISHRLLTRESAAAYLAVSERTLDRLVQTGDLPAYRIGAAFASRTSIRSSPASWSSQMR